MSSTLNPGTMKLAIIKKTTSIYCNALKSEGLKVPFKVTRGALADLLHHKDLFHLEQLELCLNELHGPEFKQSERTLTLLAAADAAVNERITELRGTRKSY